MEPENRQGRDAALAVRDPAQRGPRGLLPEWADAKLQLKCALAWMAEIKGPDSPHVVWSTAWNVMTNRRAPLRTRLRAAQAFMDRLDPIPRPELAGATTTVNAVQVNLIAPVRAGEGQQGASVPPEGISIRLAANGHSTSPNGAHDGK